MKRILGWALLALAAAGCDPQRIKELEEGVATEADVRARFGSRKDLGRARRGAHVRVQPQPAGDKNYMITIGPDGKMSALRQVLNPTNFARIQPGMPMEQVRRMLGKPARQTPYELKREIAWDWRYNQPPNTPMVFTVCPDAQDNKGGR
jgi:hypothetical protein